jgi:Helix-turn-helix domain of resolvase
MGRGFMAMMWAMTKDERLRIVKRTHEGRKIAQAKGVRMGRKSKLTLHQKTEARKRIAKGQSTRDLAKSYGVSVSTLSRLEARGNNQKFFAQGGQHEINNHRGNRDEPRQFLRCGLGRQNKTHGSASAERRKLEPRHATGTQSGTRCGA